MQICLRGRLRRGVLRLGRLPLLVMHGGRSKHYTLLWLVEGEADWGARDFLGLMLRGPHRHRRVYPRRSTRHSISNNIIRNRCISLNFSRGISNRRGMSITRGIKLSLNKGISLSSLYWSNSMSSLLISNSMSSLLNSNSMSNLLLNSNMSLIWRMRMGAFQEGLTSCLFYRTSINMWHTSFGMTKQ